MVMKKFMDDNFMLNNETAAKLFNDYAKDMPIFDYHCHLSPQMMYEDKPFENISEIVFIEYFGRYSVVCSEFSGI